MRKKRKLTQRPVKTSLGDLMLQAADNMPKDTTGSLNILSMIRDTTIRFNRLKRYGIKNFNCG